MTKLLFLSQFFQPEPGASRGLPLATELRRFNFETEVITGFPNYPGGKVYPGYHIKPWQREIIDDVPVVRVALWPSHNQKPLDRIANYVSFALSSAVLGPLLTKSADVGFVYHPPATIGFPAAVLKTLKNIPFVYHISDMWPESVVESGMVKNPIAKKIIGESLAYYCKWVYRHTAAITVLSPGFKRMLIERGVPAEKIHVVYNWADDRMLLPVPRNQDLADKFGFAGKFNILYAGNLGPYQGLDTVIRAAAEVKDLKDLQIVIIGSGIVEQEIKTLAQDLGVTNVRFISRVSETEMAKIYSLADVSLVHLKDLPFFSATVPGKTQVSLACGKPVLMAVRGDAGDIVRDARAGIVIEPENVTAMAQAFRDFFKMPRTELESMGTNAREYYLREMCLNVAVEKMANIFNTVKN